MDKTGNMLGALHLDSQKYLKWYNTTVGIIDESNRVQFINSDNNLIAMLYSKGKQEWSESDFRDFLKDRLVSRDRRDIEKILFRCSLLEYDEIKIAYVTRAINARDLFWISFEKNEKMEDVINPVFESIFVKKVDTQGDSLNSPEGMNIKRYGVSKGYYGIYKQRLHPMSSDVESEVAVYELSKHLGVDCCPAWLVKKHNDDVLSFSKFVYNFAEEYIVHVRSLFKSEERTANEYVNLVTKFPDFKTNIQKMILLDFVTRQVDRHLSNIAIKISKGISYFYPLYDNGRSLFHENDDIFINNAISDIELYSSEFGSVGTYIDYVHDICIDTDIKQLIDLSISKDTIYNVYKTSGLKGIRLEGGTEWTYKCLHELEKL